MITYKHIEKIIIAIVIVAVAFCFIAAAYPEKLSEKLGGEGVTMEYETRLFDTDQIIDIDILMDEDTWNEMLSNVMSEEYYVCDVVINGEKFNEVAIRPKGNTSLSAIAMDPDSDRYSLKLEFDHFVSGQTCFGLDKLILNNNYADATNMKEAIIYDMYQYLGADASLYNYAKVSVNGEYTGVYLALEGVEQSFMLRNYGTRDGELYKPDSMEMGGGDDKDKASSGSGFGGGNMPPQMGSGQGNPPGGGDFDPSNMPDMGDFDPSNMPDMGDFDPSDMPDMGGFDPSNMPDMGDFDPSDMPDMGDFDPSDMPDSGDFDPENMPKRDESNVSEDGSGEKASSGREGPGKGGFSRGNGGANLNYTDDELDSYSTIWEGSITGTTDTDHRRVVTALKNISEGNDLEEYLDIDNILKYMAVHVFAVNQDSLSGSMAHNYYLYEYDGMLNMIPWDYNLSLGGMSMGRDADATEMVNDAIDTPFSGTEFFDALLENEEYLERYHEYLDKLVEEYVNEGRFDQVYERIRSQIDALVETDPTAFYDYDEYDKAAELLNETVKLRAESIEGQLNGTIPSTDEGQREDSSSLIDASHINVKDMGEFNMGGGNFGPGSDKDKKRAERIAGRTEQSSEEADTTEDEASSSLETEGDEGADRDNKPEGFKGFDPGNMPGGSFNPQGVQGSSADMLKTIGIYGACLLVMVGATVGFSLFKRRKR